jgi:Acetyl-CoA acetyltransferase
MKTAVIVDSVRTGLAKSFRGGFKRTRPDEMLAHIIKGRIGEKSQFTTRSC